MGKGWGLGVITLFSLWLHIFENFHNKTSENSILESGKAHTGRGEFAPYASNNRQKTLLGIYKRVSTFSKKHNSIENWQNTHTLKKE